MPLHANWQETWRRLQLLGIVGAAGTAVILRLSAAQLLGIKDDRLYAGICQHK